MIGRCRGSALLVVLASVVVLINTVLIEVVEAKDTQHPSLRGLQKNNNETVADNSPGLSGSPVITSVERPADRPGGGGSGQTQTIATNDNPPTNTGGNNPVITSVERPPGRATTTPETPHSATPQTISFDQTDTNTTRDASNDGNDGNGDHHNNGNDGNGDHHDNYGRNGGEPADADNSNSTSDHGNEDNNHWNHTDDNHWNHTHNDHWNHTHSYGNNGPIQGKKDKRKDKRNSHAVQAKNGSLGKINATLHRANVDQIQQEATTQLKQRILKVHFGGTGNEDVQAKTTNFDKRGNVHLRFKQKINGMDVEGAALVLHIDANGTISSINGEFLQDNVNGGVSLFQQGITTVDADPQPLLDQALSEAGIEGGVWVGQPEKAVVRRTSDGGTCFAWKRPVKYNITDGSRGAGPQLDFIYADSTYTGTTAADASSTANVFANLFQSPNASSANSVDSNVTQSLTVKTAEPTGALCARHPQYMGAGIPNVMTVDCHQTKTSCTTVSTSSTRINTGDSAVNGAHNYAIATYEYYWTHFGRDSIDDNGKTLISLVHYGYQYNNAFWDGTEGAYGDGDGKEFRPLSLSADVVGHELTHGVTGSTSQLIYNGESGAVNEAMSDIFGAMVDKQEGANEVDTWLIGWAVYTPEISGDALRSMADPAATGDYDYYPTRYLGTVDNGGVHYNSGIGNLAFKLLVTGGPHPRGKTNVVVTGIGFDAAEEIFYNANVNCLTPSSDFQMARFCTAEQFGGDYKANVHQAWDAVAVPGGPIPPAIILVDGVPLTGQQSTFIQDYELQSIDIGDTVTCSTSGRNGDADLYLRFGAEPGLSRYTKYNACSSYGPDSNESCTTGAATTNSTTLYIFVHAYKPYTGLTITCSIATAAPGASPPPTNTPTKAPTRGPSRPPTPSPTTPPIPPTPSPTRPPTMRPTPAPTQQPIAKPSGSHSSLLGCFSSQTTVEVLGTGLTAMSDLKIGDRVLTATSGKERQYEPVYGFGHRHTSKLTEFVQIYYEFLTPNGDNFTKSRTDNNLVPLEMTGKHLLYVEGKANPIRADAIQVNDFLKSHSRESHLDSPPVIRVSRIETVLRNGVYAPFTPSGTIVVEEVGIMASTYISLQNSAVEYIELRGGLELTFLPQQTLCHVWMAPYRIFCTYYRGDKFCQGEEYTDTGRSYWVHFGKLMSEWGEQQNLPLQLAVLTLVLVILALSMLLEVFLNLAWSRDWLLLTAALVCFRVVQNQRRYIRPATLKKHVDAAGMR